MTPIYGHSPTPRNSTVSSMTRIVKGHSGEADTLADEKDMFVLSDDEIDGDLHNAQETNMSEAKMSIKSNLSMRSSSGRLGIHK